MTIKTYRRKDVRLGAEPPGVFSILLVLMTLSFSPAFAEEVAALSIPVHSSAFAFSPGNWVGDAGRGGELFRQTWNSGAYFTVAWKSETPKPVAELCFDVSGYTKDFPAPRIAYCIDGVWKINVSCKERVPIENLKGKGAHELFVCLTSSKQVKRWGSPGESGLNVVKVTGLKVNPESTVLANAEKKKWAMIVGDSITEGCGTSPLAPYSFLLGEALRTQDYAYCISACGWSGWLNKGDNPPGDVPGYYVISGSENGKGGIYHDDTSRWNKIDGNRHSLLDAEGRISAYGGTKQEPSLILINYGTNDILHRSNRSDTFASMVQGLQALRKSAPDASIVILIPFGQYYAQKLKDAVSAHREANPGDEKIHIVDLGVGVAKTLRIPKGPLGGLHPNDKGHANFAAKLIPQVLQILRKDQQL